MDRLLLIDTYNYIHRAYHALPKTFKNAAGEPTNAIYGFTSMLISTLGVLKPQYVIAAFDDPSAPTFRDSDYAEYKAHRKPMEPELTTQLPKIEEIIDAFGIQKLMLTGYEADDIIGCIATQAAKAGHDVVIVSNDKDILQILGPHIKVFIPDNSKTGGSFFGEAQFKAKYGFDPVHMIDYKALRGDTSDNIKGVHGIGEKTAKELVEKYGTVDNVYRHIDELPTAVSQKLSSGKEDAILSRKLATIVCSADVRYDPSGCRIRNVDRLKVLEVLKRHNFKSLIKRLGVEAEEKKSDDGQLKMI